MSPSSGPDRNELNGLFTDDPLWINALVDMNDNGVDIVYREEIRVRASDKGRWN